MQVAAEQEAAREAGEEDEGPLEVEGFLFKRLLERKPEKRQELLTLRDHLLATSSSSDTLKVLSHQGHQMLNATKCNTMPNARISQCYIIGGYGASKSILYHL